MQPAWNACAHGSAAAGSSVIGLWQIVRSGAASDAAGGGRLSGGILLSCRQYHLARLLYLLPRPEKNLVVSHPSFRGLTLPKVGQQLG